jgi:hypothetical protein
VVTGGRRFGLPVIARESTYEGCELIVFENAVPDVAVQGRGQEKLSLEQIEKNRVVRIDTDVEWGEKDEKLSIWYAKPKPNILIATTDAGFVKTMLQRIARPAMSSSTLLDFPEWKYVDTQAPVWGIRHRRTATPFYIVAKTSKDGFPFSDLSGFTFSYQPQPATSVLLHFHFTEKARDVLPRVIQKDLGAKLISPLVAGRKVAIHEQSGAVEWNSDTPQEMSFMIHHFMGYVVCP